MDATSLDTFIDALIDDLTPAPAPADDGDRRLCHLLDSPRRVVDDERLLAVLDAAVALRNMSDYLLAQATAAAERAGIPKRSGAELLTTRGVAPGAAQRAARVGRAAHTMAALIRQQRLGALGIEFVDAVGRGVTLIHKRVALSDADRAQVVRALMLESTPKRVDVKAREIAIEKAAALPPPAEGEEPVVPVAENSDLNEMTLHQNSEGRTSVTADLDALIGEELFAALDPLCRPVPLPDGSPDPRSTEKRRADALGQLLRTYLSNSSRPTSGGVLPHVTLTRPATAAMLSAGVGAGGSVDMLGFTGPISAATADLITCDSTATTVLVDQHGAPLDVGRSERLFPPHIRKALAIRDHGCAFPGCGRPVSWCDAHHLTPWAAGGSTCVDNGVMLCRHHHTMIHQTDWQVYLGRDRHPWFIPPYDRTGPEPEHLRSHSRRTLTLLPTAA